MHELLIRVHGSPQVGLQRHPARRWRNVAVPSQSGLPEEWAAQIAVSLAHDPAMSTNVVNMLLAHSHRASFRAVAGLGEVSTVAIL